MNHFKSIGFLLASTIFAAPAFAVVCGNTTFSQLSATSCLGPTAGTLTGSSSETTYLNNNWGTYSGGSYSSGTSYSGGGTYSGGTRSYTYGGSSSDANNGPFTTNPMVSSNGTLTFKNQMSGAFVIGLEAGGYYSYYSFNAPTAISSLTYSSTNGVAFNQPLAYASMYYAVAPVPEPQTYALILAGIGAVAFMGKRRRSDLNAALRK